MLFIAEIAGDDTQPAEDLVALDGVTEDMASILAANGILTRDDLAEQNTELKRQLNLDSTNLSQTEYLNQKLQNEITNYKSILEQNERVLRTAMDKEEILRGSVYKLQEQNKELETVSPSFTVLEIRPAIIQTDIGNVFLKSTTAPFTSL